MKYFEDLDLGAEFRTPGRTITEADLVGFAAISGDYGALEQLRGGSGLSPVVPEILVFSISSGLGFRVPDTQPQVLAFMVLDWRLLGTVRVGDTIHCRIRVTGKRPMKDGGVLIEKREIFNQRGEVVQEAEYKLLVARRPRD